MNHRTGWRLGYRSLLHVEFFDVFPKLGIESVSIILLAWQISGRIAGKVEEWRRGVINGKFLFTWPSSDKRNLLPLWGISFHPSLNSSLAKEFLFDDFIIGFVVQRFARHDHSRSPLSPLPSLLFARLYFERRFNDERQKFA